MTANILVHSAFTQLTELVQRYDLAKAAQGNLLPTVVLTTLVALAVSTLLPKSFGDGIPLIGGIPFVGSWAFFTRRMSFMNEGVRRFGKMFAFNVLHHKIVALSSEDARRVFFGSKELNFTEGYKILFGAAPDITEVGLEREHDLGDAAWFGRRLLNVLRRDRLAITIPMMFEDLDRRMEKWGSSGTFNPFDDIYNIVFQLTIRAGACREIADDPELVQRVAQLYWDMERGSTPVSVLLPWLPSPARKRKNKATTELFQIIKKCVEERRGSGRTETDAMQVLLDEGDCVNDVVQFVMGVLFAGIVNTGIMSSWIVLFLHTHPEWKAKATNEVRGFITKYAARPEARLAEQLAQVPPQVWDEELDVIDACLRETIRVVQNATTIRRAVADTVIDGRRIPRGTFLAYAATATHMDPDIYPDPELWDPSRYERGEDKKQHFAFLGWGVGRHPCLGMRFAKLEIKAILAMFLTRYDYEVVDASGKPVETLPPPDRDNLFQSPPMYPVYVKYTKTSE